MPDWMMPTDQQGMRADIVMSPDSPIRRMNEGQRFEQAINRISEFVRRKMETLVNAGDWQAAWDVYIGWLADVDDAYAELVASTRSTPESRKELVMSTIKDKIYLKVTPSTESMSPENLLKWRDKYDAHPSPVTFTKCDNDGNNPQTFTTDDPVTIGAKYLWYLCKLPTATSSGPSFTSHFGVPVKPGGSTRERYRTAMTPIRGGEDEMRLLQLEGNSREVRRYKDLMADSPTGVREMVTAQLLADHPTQIGRVNISDATLSQTSAPIDLFHHTMASLGIESRRVGTQKKIEDYVDGNFFPSILANTDPPTLAAEEGDDATWVQSETSAVVAEMIADDLPAVEEGSASDD